MRTWFITGASRGFGARIAELALAKGDNVVATARNPSTVTDRLGEHSRLLPLPLDVTDEAQAGSAATAAIERFGCIDVLLNNAGFGLMGAVEEATAAEVEHLYKTNVFGVLNVTRAILPHMRAKRSGRILNISSIGGYRAGTGFGVYCSTKFAVEGLSEALHHELAPLGIHVTVIEPGYFRTDFLDASSLAVSPANCGLRRDGRKSAVSRRQPQSRSAGGSGQIRGGDCRFCRCARTADPVTIGQRYGRCNRGQTHLGQRHSREMACRLGVDRFQTALIHRCRN